MSRTYRRNTKELIRQSIGSFEDNLRDSWWMEYRYPGLAPEVAYAQRLAWWRRDCKSGDRSPPSWYVNLYFTRRQRREEQIALKAYMLSEEWDAFLTTPYLRSAAYRWF